MTYFSARINLQTLNTFSQAVEENTILKNHLHCRPVLSTTYYLSDLLCENASAYE